MLLDTDFFSKPKTMRLTQKFGALGSSAVLLICTALINANDGKMPREDVLALSFLLSCEQSKWEEVLNYLLEIGWLKESDGYIWSERTLEDRQRVISAREAWAENGKKGGRPAKNQTETKINPTITKNNPNVSPSTEPEPEPEPEDPNSSLCDPLERYLNLAQPFIATPTGKEPWESDNQYINAGRRPLKKYPSIFLTAPELAQVFQQYESAGIPTESWTEAFQLVESKLKNKSQFNVSAFSWLTGFVKGQLLENLTRASNFKRVKKYENATRG